MRLSLGTFVSEGLRLLNLLSINYNYQLVVFNIYLYSTLIFIYIKYNSYNIIYILTNYNNLSFNSFNFNNLLFIFKSLYNWDTFILIILLLVLLILYHLNGIKIKYIYCYS